MDSKGSSVAYPKAFIGSSSEGLDAAKALLACFENEPIEAVLWLDAGFGLSTTTIENLERILNEYSFGIFIFTKDDEITVRDKDLKAPRDNVVFELGLWLGRWGRSNCVIVSEKGSDLRLPSDLSSVSRAEFEIPEDKSSLSIKKAFRSVATQIADACNTAAQKNRLQIPAKWVWQKLIDPKSPIAIAIASPELLRPRIVGDKPAVTEVEDIEYVRSRQYTGMGETEAVGLIFDILSGSGNQEFPLIFFASDVPNRRLRGPLIPLGGWSSNPISESMLQKDVLPIKMKRDGITVDDKSYAPSMQGNIVDDYCVILWFANPYSPGHRLLLSAGYHTFGTVGGIEYLTHSSGKLPDLAADSNENFIGLLHVRSIDTRREFPELIEFRTW